MMVVVRSRHDLDHEVNGQCGDGNQGRAREKFHLSSNQRLDPCLSSYGQKPEKDQYYQVIRV